MEYIEKGFLTQEEPPHPVEGAGPFSYMSYLTVLGSGAQIEVEDVTDNPTDLDTKAYENGQTIPAFHWPRHHLNFKNPIFDIAPPEVKFYEHGIEFVSRKVRDLKQVAPSPPRGEIKSENKRSMVRLLRTLSKVNTQNYDGAVFLSLTYHLNWEGRNWKRDLDAYQKRLRRFCPEVGVIWKAEIQKRGAPHFHLIVYSPKYQIIKDKDGNEISRSRYPEPLTTDANRKALGQMWHTLVEKGNKHHAKYGADVQTIGKVKEAKGLHTYDAVCAYLFKYLSKEVIKSKEYNRVDLFERVAELRSQLLRGETPKPQNTKRRLKRLLSLLKQQRQYAQTYKTLGRRWGKNQALDTDPTHTMPLSDREEVKMKRKTRKHMSAKKRLTFAKRKELRREGKPAPKEGYEKHVVYGVTNFVITGEDDRAFMDELFALVE